MQTRLNALEQFPLWLSETLERWRMLYLVLFSVIYFVITGVLAATKLMWFDEIATSYVSRAPTIGDIWTILYYGGDGHPPLSFALVHWSYGLFGQTHLTGRLPFILGFWVMSICIFLFVARRCGALYGAAAMLFPLITLIYTYAYECRSYALVLGGTAAALLAWQRAAENPAWWKKVLLALALACVISSHFYGVFVWVPLGAGELVRTIRNKRIDWTMWLAIFAGLLPLPFYLPIARAMNKVYFQAGYWARPSFSNIEDSYRFMLDLAMAPLLIAIVLWAIASKYYRAAKTERNPLPLHEVVAVIALMMVPVLAVAASFVLGAYTQRYGIASFVGLTIALAFLAWSRSSGSPVLGTACVLVFSGWFLVKQPGTFNRLRAESHGLPFHAAQPFDSRKWVAAVRQSSMPVATTHAVFYLQAHEYAPADVTQRLAYLTNRPAAVQMGMSSAADTNIMMISRFAPVPTLPYEDFIASNRRFLVCANTDQPSWLIPYLLKSGARLELRTTDGTERLYEVTMP